jgi:hypothetical protein
MKQVTLVAFYGQKRGDLEKLIKECWKLIDKSKFRKVFEPYHINQVHGTIVGMGKLIGFDNLFNANSWQSSGDKKIMDYNNFISTVKSYLPIKIRFGGFDESYESFKSFGKSPYERSFQIQRPTSRVTLIGWPYDDKNFTEKRILCDLRQDIETKCKIKHKYPDDNDFFMVLGEIKGIQLLTDSEITSLETESRLLEESIRKYLENNPIDVDITDEQVFLVQYDKETLPLDSTNAYCIQNAGIDVNFIQNLYR